MSIHRAAYAAVVLGSAWAGFAQAQDVTLKVHHFLPPMSNIQVNVIEPWAQAVEEASGGRIAVEIYPAMQLGGKAPQLYDQVRDGIADVVWTLPGYTPGRFPTVEVFELPFMGADAESTSQALQAFIEQNDMAEFAEIHPLFFHVHAPGKFHMKGDGIETLEDFAGKQIRAPTRVTNEALAALGATPVGMPVPQVPEALSRGVVDGVVIPWEVVLPLRVQELTDSHTEIGGDRGFYTSVFVFGMNKDTYESLPDDLKQVIDEHSGMEWAAKAGVAFDQAELPGRAAAEALGHPIYTIEGAELERWKQATAPVTEHWIAEMDAKGVDGAALVEEARRLIAEQAGATN